MTMTLGTEKSYPKKKSQKFLEMKYRFHQKIEESEWHQAFNKTTGN